MHLTLICTSVSLINIYTVWIQDLSRKLGVDRNVASIRDIDTPVLELSSPILHLPKRREGFRNLGIFTISIASAPVCGLTSSSILNIIHLVWSPSPPYCMCKSQSVTVLCEKIRRLISTFVILKSAMVLTGCVSQPRPVPENYSNRKTSTNRPCFSRAQCAAAAQSVYGNVPSVQSGLRGVCRKVMITQLSYHVET